MQTRHKNRKQYFEEQASTSREYYIKYVEQFVSFLPGLRVLEIGCGEGGNLLPFAERGCSVEGLDLSPTRIRQAEEFFREYNNYAYRFSCGDFCKMNAPPSGNKYDVILVHDVIEHVPQVSKLRFMQNIGEFLSPSGIAFFGFPAWQMPFGGHQQICLHAVSKMPWIHLLPKWLYKGLLLWSGESVDNVRELMSIRESNTTIERFESLCRKSGLRVALRHLWFINPHYKRKFGLKPRRVASLFACVPFVRNLYTTSCFYVLRAGSVDVGRT